MSDDSNISDMQGHDDPALSRLYQAAERPLPPPQLDAAIRRAARATPGERRPRRLQWLGALAASVVAAVLVVQLYPRPATTPEATGTGAGALFEERAAPAREQRDAVGAPPALLQDSVRRPAPSAKTESATRAEPAAEAEFAPLPDAPAALRLLAPAAVPAPAGEAQRALDAIVALLDAGDTALAAERLDAFRARYPDVPVPPEILTRIPAAHVPAKAAPAQ